MDKPKVETTLEFTLKEFISTIVSILVLVLIGYDAKDLIYGLKGFNNISITLVICSVFALTYLIMLLVKFANEGKIIADKQHLRNKETFDDGFITVKKEKELPVILPIQQEEEEKKS